MIGFRSENLDSGSDHLSICSFFIQKKQKTKPPPKPTFLNQSHSRRQSGVAEKLEGRPQWLFSCFSAISDVMCYTVNLSFSHRPGMPWVTKVTGRLYSKPFSVCSRTSPCSLEHEHLDQLHIQGSGTWC